jgi:ribonucleotide reductase alpha subunit
MFTREECWLENLSVSTPILFQIL